MSKFVLYQTGQESIDRNFQQIRNILDNILNKLQDNGNLRIPGNIGVGNASPGTSPGNVVKKIQIFDNKGAPIGYIALYDSIT